jgi:hypothetical protein
MDTNVNVNVEQHTRGEMMQIRKLITAAGRIQEKIADEVASLEALKKEIKSFTLGMATVPKAEIVIVSGEYVASLSAEAQYRESGAAENRTLFGLLGVDKFLAIATFPVKDMEAAIGSEQFDAVCPKRYSGKGRKFSLKKKV